MKKRLMRWKVYFDRGRQYTVVIQFAMSAATLVAVIATAGFLAEYYRHKVIYTVIGLLLVIGGHIVIGRIEFLLGLHQEENRRHTESNPVHMELLQLLREIKSQIDQKLNEND